MKKELRNEVSLTSSIAGTVAVLAEAAGYKTTVSGARFAAAETPGAPDERHFLIAAYGEIEDLTYRQAILDIVAAIAYRQSGTKGPAIDLSPGQN